jgi:hypothetical protein
MNYVQNLKGFGRRRYGSVKTKVAETKAFNEICQRENPNATIKIVEPIVEDEAEPE